VDHKLGGGHPEARVGGLHDYGAHRTDAAVSDYFYMGRTGLDGVVDSHALMPLSPYALQVDGYGVVVNAG